MKRLIIILSAVLATVSISASGQTFISTSEENCDAYNTWIAFVKDFNVDKVPSEVVASITADSKYWMWINGELAVFEGCLKRGPAPGDSYCDKVDLAPWLRPGANRIAILVWHFGRDGFSHIDSGKSWLMLDAPAVGLGTDKTWLCRIDPAYSCAEGPKPNFRLSEANLRYDARLSLGNWQDAPVEELEGFAPARVVNDPGCGRLVDRPVPMWKDFGIVKADNLERRGDTTIVRLPYNMQMTPIVEISDPVGGHVVNIKTDHAYHGMDYNNWAQYVTCAGEQSYESLGWLNGDQIWIISGDPEVRVTGVSYRQTGYATEPEGTFNSSDGFTVRFWEKALHTLYINMRDTFFDCPDRERSQWWGDTVILMSECFYSLSTSTHALMRKAILELCSWANPDGALHSPIPGNYDTELPGQMLAAISTYGFWNYYMNTGDEETIRTVYPAVRKYLSLWEVDGSGLTVFRKTKWNWGDWGKHKDMRLIYAGWHSLALQSAANMAKLLGEKDDIRGYETLIAGIKEGYNACWTDEGYRSDGYKEEIDDRVQALAVLAGIVPDERREQIFEVIKAHENASPYMEKYVMESIFRLGHGDYAMERFHKRYGSMVNEPDHTTLFEGWSTRDIAAGGGTVNHAWSGGPLTVISQELFGIRPTAPAYKRMSITPQPAGMERAELTFPTVRGTVGCSFTTGPDGHIQWEITVPRGTKAKFSYAGKRRTFRGGTHRVKTKLN